MCVHDRGSLRPVPRDSDFIKGYRWMKRDSGGRDLQLRSSSRAFGHPVDDAKPPISMPRTSSSNLYPLALHTDAYGRLDWLTNTEIFADDCGREDAFKYTKLHSLTKYCLYAIFQTPFFRFNFLPFLDVLLILNEFSYIYCCVIHINL